MSKRIEDVLGYREDRNQALKVNNDGNFEFITLLDPIERGEERCEDWAFENVHGDSFTCCCGNDCKLEVGETLSPDPYAIPVCPECFEKAMDEKFGPAWRAKMGRKL